MELAKIETKNKNGTFGILGASPSDKPLRVTLDSGSSISLFPRTMHAAALKAFPDAKPSSIIRGLHEVDCARRQESSTVDFTFSGATIKVPYSQFIMNWDGVCYLTMISHGK